MAKINGPLLSVAAHGSISKILNFSKKRTGQQGRKFNYPTKDPTGQQLERRRLNEYATAMWIGMSVGDKATWETNARTAGVNMSGYHYFLRRALRDPAEVMKMIIFRPLTYNVGTAIYNIPNRNYDGVLQNAATYPLPARAAHDYLKRRYCYYFQATKGNISTPAVKNVPFIYNSKYTWVYFFRLPSIVSSRHITAHYIDGVSGYRAIIHNSGELRWFSESGVGGVALKAPLVGTDWTHIVMTLDGSGGGIPVAAIYKNGVIATSDNTLSGALTTTVNAPFETGRNSTSQFFLGYFSDHVYINRIATAAEIRTLSNFAFAKLQKVKPER